ncbi:DUF4189 domain-containing protein [Phyllobacterium sp. P30BS-XVII]|uniref:DUF4189 domain-containing protein n=1 Tax=Phyllobacterium sp. P30BS-XVII TaxID=2587046 RepID=UPI0013AEE34D|nr:DUF4189 domain-containing protein [Phyllobacterium sp. P30BS-XVII]MBA8903905.1 hypothetical protein [Phyllobacterium sp. P30BS-XVII]
MSINRILSIGLLSMVVGLSPSSHAADMSVLDPIPEPHLAEKGIWGAIAYSTTDNRHGFFWGADKRDEAESTALKYCKNADGKNCKVVTVFRNHRHWDDDGTSFPYEHCAALSVGKSMVGEVSYWGAASDVTRQKAEEKATNLCGGEGKECKIREWVCT